MEYAEEDFLQLSGLQHFLFCRRQWALIAIEGQWAENLRTTDGEIMHTRAHNNDLTEKRGDLIITRGTRIFSRTMGVSGQCDVLEYHRNDAGVKIHGWEGLWIPFPVEYKRGEPKENNCDKAQLCGQAMCLEEMFCCTISEGALFYGERQRRFPVLFSEGLRQEVRCALEEMHDLYRKGWTPNVRRSKSCNACSLKEICLPVLMKGHNVKEYMEEHM